MNISQSDKDQAAISEDEQAVLTELLGLVEPLNAKVSAEDRRARLLAACRESKENDYLLKTAMIQQTLANMPNYPSVRRAKELGIRPLTDPPGSIENLNMQVRQVGKARGVLFEIDGDYFLYSMTSAAKTTKEGENDWTTMCVKVIEELRPKEIYVASLSRLVRSFEHSGKLLSAVSRHVDMVHAGTTQLEMKGGDTSTGQLLWALMAMIAASERNLIVQRLTAGQVAKYNRGEWIGGVGVVPMGYKLDPESLNLVPDPESFPALKATFELMADPTLSGWQIGQQMGKLGVTTKNAKDRFGTDATVSDYIYSNSFVRNIRGWMPLYLTGEHTTHWPNPFPGVEHIAGMVIHPTPNNVDGPGELQFHYTWGRPSIDPAIIHAAIAGRDERQCAPKSGGAARARIAPLSGIRWQTDGMEHWIVTSSKTKYFLRSRNLEIGAS